MHSIALSILLLFQGLMFSAQTWSFTGEVLEVRQVERLGFPAQVALVRSADFDAWVIQRMDEGPFEVVLGNAAVGDRVRVSISGAHVSRNGVDWDLCQPADSNYCRLGWLYDSGPLSGDWNVPISPSNEFIHLGHPNPSWEYALFWETGKLVKADNTIVNPGRRSEKPQTGCRRCGALCQGCIRCSTGIGRVSHLAEIDWPETLTEYFVVSRKGGFDEVFENLTRCHADPGFDFSGRTP